MTTLEVLSDSEKNRVRITGVKAMQLQNQAGQSLVKVETDAGIDGIVGLSERFGAQVSAQLLRDRDLGGAGRLDFRSAGVGIVPSAMGLDGRHRAVRRGNLPVASAIRAGRSELVAVAGAVELGRRGRPVGCVACFQSS